VFFVLETAGAGEGIQDVPRGVQREEQRESYAGQQANGGEQLIDHDMYRLLLIEMHQQNHTFRTVFLKKKIIRFVAVELA
jgi:hypothetical protein